MQRRLLLATLMSTVLVVGWACGDPAPAAPEPSPNEPGTTQAEPAAPDPSSETTSVIGVPPSTDAERAAALEARTGAQRLGGMLKTRLLAEMARGPAHAASFCGDSAQSLTGGVAEDTGVRVGRSSTRLRNASNAGPDWVRAWLAVQEDREPGAVTPASGIDGQIARFIAPIRVVGPCLACHGPPDSLDEGVRAVLSERYPEDRATGYAVGDLRGALWAEAPVAP